MRVRVIPKIDAGNPFLSDPFNMGTQIGSNVTVMYGKHVAEHQRYLIVVDTTTGERFEITFPEVR
jgi:hypothetical protein